MDKLFVFVGKMPNGVKKIGKRVVMIYFHTKSFCEVGELYLKEIRDKQKTISHGIIYLEENQGDWYELYTEFTRSDLCPFRSAGLCRD
jgi:hypothetical protein